MFSFAYVVGLGAALFVPPFLAKPKIA